MKVAVVGYGYWGVHIVRNLVTLVGPSEVIVCDRDPCRLDAAAAAHPGTERVSRFPELCERADIAAIAVVTPVESHHALASQALAAGKHVFLEKPMTRSSREASELVELAESRGLILMVDHTFLFTGAVQTIRSLLHRGELGTLLSVQSERTNLGLFRQDVDVVYDLAVHDVAILDHLLEMSPDWVRADGLAHPYDRHASDASLVLSYGGMIARCHVSWLAPVKTRRVTLIGAERTVVWDEGDTVSPVTVHECGIDARHPGSSIGPVAHRRGAFRSVEVASREALEAELEYFLSCVGSGEQPTICDGRSGLRSVCILESAQRALASGIREPVPPAREPRAMARV